jgi:hypothetical protein
MWCPACRVTRQHDASSTQGDRRPVRRQEDEGAQPRLCEMGGGRPAGSELPSNPSRRGQRKQ